MPITYKNIDIANIYQQGTDVTISNISLAGPPMSDFEKNNPIGIQINGRDLSNLAISKYQEFNTMTSVTLPIGCKHISAYGWGGGGGRGGRGGDGCKGSSGNKTNGGAGGGGGNGGFFAISKYQLNNADTTMNINVGALGINGNSGNDRNCGVGGSAGAGNDGNDGSAGGLSSVDIGNISIASANGGGGGKGGGSGNSSNAGGGGFTGSSGVASYVSGYVESENSPKISNSTGIGATNSNNINATPGYVRVYFHYV